MGLHFYDASPSWPTEQAVRLRPSLSLVKAGIPFVVFAEDALAIVHRVPTGLFDQQLLVPDDRVFEAAGVLCRDQPYTVIDGHNDNRWKDYKFINPAQPYAFSGAPTILMQHNTPPNIIIAQYDPGPARILIHAASSFNFDIRDISRTCLNPEPPSPPFATIRFPTLTAFFDSLIDTYLEFPLDFVHHKLREQLSRFIGYLSLYTASNKGIHRAPDAEGELKLIPICLQVLEEIKEENRLYLTRYFMGIPSQWETSALERFLIKEAKFKESGLAYKRPQIPYHPYHRAKGLVSPTPEIQLRKQLESHYTEKRLLYGILQRKWPRIFRHLPITQI